MNKKATEAAGKVVGKAHAAAARMKGDKGIFRKLQEEHAEVNTLMMRTAASRDEASRRELFAKIRKELLSHAKGEESEFYPVLKQHAETRALGERAEREHHEVERMLDQLEQMDFASDTWKNEFERLMKNVQRHVEEEEHEIFPRAKDVFDDAQAERLERAYLDRKQQVMAQL